MIVRSLALVALVLAAVPAASAQDAPHTLDLSTHVLDLARGVGGAGVPVTLEHKTGDTWRLVGRAEAAENGRVSSFQPADLSAPVPGAGLYRLTFDMTGYWKGLGDDAVDLGPVAGAEFFPDITVQFRISDPSVHTHVPVVVSPFGYSTYRGN